MIRLNIDGREVTAKEGMTVLEAASSAGIEIPAMCLNSDSGHFTSCMVCLVREGGSAFLVPSCALPARDGMNITTSDEEIEDARKTAIELLLSEHAGDCEAPCRISCPANMDIPLMNRYLEAGMADEALTTIMKDIAFPSVLGRICPAPCEGACHRKVHDSPVSVCALKRFAGDNGGISVTQEPPGNSRVAVIGAGIAGLSAVFYLQVRGINCTLYDRNPLPGGALRYEIDDASLEREVLDRETEFVLSSGVEYHPGITVDHEHFTRLTGEFDAVVVATGNFTDRIGDWGMANDGKQVLVDKKSYRTSIPNVFAIGNVNRKTRLAIRSAAQGKEVAFSILQFLKGEEPAGEPKLFNSRTGRLSTEEVALYMKGVSPEARIKEKEGPDGGLSAGEAALEAARCMHCECLKPGNCILRDLAGKFGASQRRFMLESRKKIKKFSEHDRIVFEPGKCIKCGICVRLAGKYAERPGLAFTGRGYDGEIAVPFDESIKDALKRTGSLIAKACPTGALAAKAEKPDKIKENEEENSEIS